MPKIDVNEKLFFDLLGRGFGKDELESLLPAAKAELDEWDSSGGPASERTIKIELNDTNRPDLWSTSGLARALRTYLGSPAPRYGFFSREDQAKDAGKLVVEVDPSVQAVRPFIAAFVISGKPITDALLKDIIQTQEKLCWNFGRKRRSIAMGVYRSSMMSYPVRYSAVDPQATRFVPLGSDKEMSLSQILKEHPKGLEFAFILEGLKRYPYLTDAKGETLSFPPVINSASLGAVEVGDTDLFVELTGTDMPSLCLAASIVACDFADSGYEIRPVRVEYPYDTPFGRSVVFPYYFQKPVSCGLERIVRFLGKSINADEAVAALSRMGCDCDRHGQYVQVFPPEYRNDFLHAADIIEDIMIGIGMDGFEPERPRDFTIGRLTKIELLSRRVKDSMSGLGFQEMIYNYLGSGADYVEKMGIDGAALIRIANPLSESVEYLRNSPLPGLLTSEAVSASAAYPHRIYEVGKVVIKDAAENYGCRTRQWLGFLIAQAEADFNEAASVLNAILFYLDVEYKVVESSDPRFILGRQASILVAGKKAGVFGELSPALLERWGIAVPASACELDLDSIIESRG
jgi:phenylalanyl-tRNA synthetase beta chain